MTPERAQVTLCDEAPRRIVLRGDLDFRHAHRVEALAADLLAEGEAPLRIDATDLRFMDSSGLSALIHVAAEASARGTFVVLAGADGQLRRLLAVTHLEFLFTIEAAGPAAPEPADLSIDLPCDPSAIALARQQLAPLLTEHRIAGPVQDDIFLALGEAIANAVRHGRADGPLGSTLRVLARCDRDRLTLEVTDHGPGFDPAAVPEPDVTRLEHGGMGIFFMRSVMDALEYRIDAGGTTVRMVKYLG